jgi:hypothetical protein
VILEKSRVLDLDNFDSFSITAAVWRGERWERKILERREEDGGR